MRFKFLIDEDFTNYKKCSMFIGAGITCSFKCDKECNQQVCQNSSLAQEPVLELNDADIIWRYLHNFLNEAVVFGGLEPLDNFNEVYNFIKEFRAICDDDIIIYTGYKEEEIQTQINKLIQFKNIIIKFGRFIPGSNSIYDAVLGVNLQSSNQYAKRY